MIDCVALLLGYSIYAAGGDVTTLCIARAFLGYPLFNTVGTMSSQNENINAVHLTDTMHHFVNKVFLMELTHVKHHGIAAAASVFMLASGISTISFLGAVQPLWRLNMLAMAALTLVTLIIVAWLLPESPIWLLRKDKESQAEASMRKIRGDIDYFDEFKLLKLAHENVNTGDSSSVPLHTVVNEILSGQRMIPRSFTFLVVFFALKGWSGIAYILINGPKIFKGQSKDLGIDKYYMSFIVSLARIPGGIAAAILLKNFSRRPVFLACALLMIVAHVMMGLVYEEILPSEFAMVAIAIIQFATAAGYNSVAGLLLGSLLPSSSRSMFAGILMAIEGISVLSQGFLEPYIVKVAGESGPFFAFAAMIAVCLCYMFVLMPETKGKSLEELEDIFKSQKQKRGSVRRDSSAAVASIVSMVRNFNRFTSKHCVS